MPEIFYQSTFAGYVQSNKEDAVHGKRLLYTSRRPSTVQNYGRQVMEILDHSVVVPQILGT